MPDLGVPLSTVAASLSYKEIESAEFQILSEMF
jgi:hypothetical protein